MNDKIPYKVIYDDNANLNGFLCRCFYFTPKVNDMRRLGYDMKDLYDDLTEWCHDNFGEHGYEIKLGGRDIALYVYDCTHIMAVKLRWM